MIKYFKFGFCCKHPTHQDYRLFINKEFFKTARDCSRNHEVCRKKRCTFALFKSSVYCEIKKIILKFARRVNGRKTLLVRIIACKNYKLSEKELRALVLP